ncbi:MAG: gluconate 2-dehydrogenase subunit 3 family protein [Gammaproteobacteria bacterium]|nr:gluconate 2-dehydrogenase subunit 3 family protein [Gammaproteobacteria bacterium]MDH5304269.1 gluconate 2-dehydrogenase subunit 3 family protein [Gammaproteobacteria bacterium]MDH5321535.1 gluconate 2-dehydrogenase subunit 3 family protein [Gammaproteobacteria bacterium]
MNNDQPKFELISRREAILRVSALFGGTLLVGQAAMLAGCAAPATGRQRSSAARGLFSQSDIELMDEIAETILPETDTPGAKAAGVGPFIALMVSDTYYAADQQVFVKGLADLQTRSLTGYGANFRVITAAQRLELVERLDAEQHLYMETRTDAMPAHYFRMIKELTLLGYFTSEIGYMQAMRYVETPGRFDPCVPLVPGEKSWAPHA